MPIVADAAVAVRGDLSGFNRDLKKADKPVGALGARLKAALSPGNLAGGLAAGFGIAKAIDFLGDATDAASDLNETVSKTGQIFGDEALPGLERWAEGAAEAFGQSKRQALDAASTFAIFGKSAGLAGDDLVGFSTELTELSSDFASFFNTSPEDAIVAIGAALRGESEPIRRYGVLLDEATLRQRAMKLGIIDTTKEALTPQQRVLAAQAEILAQTSDAQGDFTRTSAGLANQQRINAANLENAMADLGEVLLPVVTEMTKWAGDVLPEVIGQIKELIGILGGVADIFGEINDAAGVLDEAFGDVGDTVRDFGVELDPGKWAVAINDFVSGADSDLEQLQGAFDDVEGGMSIAFGRNIPADLRVARGEIADATGEIVEDMTEEVEEGAEVIVGKFGEIPEDGADAMLDAQWHLKDATQQLLDFMDQALTPMEEIARIKGFLTGKTLAQGLASNNPLIRAKAEEMRDAALARLEELGPRGQAAGAALSRGVANGIDQFSYLAFQASARLAAGVSGFLPRSEPKNPNSALRGITTLGGDMVRMIADDMTRKIALAEAAAASLAGALNPNLRVPAMAGVGGGASPIPVSMGRSGAGNTYNVTTASRPREKSTLEIAQEMRRAESLHQLPGLDTHDE